MSEDSLREVALNFLAVDDIELIAIIARSYGAGMSDPALNAAVGALYDRYGRLVYTIAIHVVNDVETAEEITQDVFVRACEGAASYHPELAKVSSWLVSITRHRAIDELRRRGVRVEKERADWPEDIGQEGADLLPLMEGPEETVETNIRDRGIRQMVADLPAEQREVLGLAYFKGLSHSEIASALGEPLGTVKSRIRLGMQRLRDLMAERGMLGP